MAARHNMHRLPPLIVAALCFLAASSTATARQIITIDWIGPDGGLYSNAANWNPNMVPTPVDWVRFQQNTTHTVLFDQNAFAGFLRVFQDDVTLDLAGFTFDFLDFSTASIQVGFAGFPIGRLSVMNGTMLGSRISIGNTGPGEMTASALHLVLTNSLDVGSTALGTMNIIGGTLFEITTNPLGGVILGGSGGSFGVGTMLVSDAGSTLDIPGILRVDFGIVTISDGGYVHVLGDTNIAVGSTPDATSDLLVTGANSMLETGNLVIGPKVEPGFDPTDSIVTVESGGTVFVDEDLSILPTGQLVIGASGTVTAVHLVRDSSVFGGGLDLLPGGTLNLTDTQDFIVIGEGGIFGDQLVLGAVAPPELLSIAGTVHIEPGASVELHADSFRPRRLINDGTLSILNTNVFMGGVNQAGMYSGDGLLVVDNSILTIQAFNHAALGYFTVVDGSTIFNTGGLLVPGGGVLFSTNSSNVFARIRADAGSLIHLEATTSELGDTFAFDGFSVDGVIDVNDSTLTLHDRDWAVLGDLTTLGDTTAGGTLHAPNGLLLELGKTLQGYGTITADILHHGLIVGEGPMPSDELALLGGVAGPGSFMGNVTFASSFAPGASPAAIDLENATFTADSTLQIELGGLTPGFQHDQLNATGTVDLQGGMLSVTLIDGFAPMTGQTFDIITASTITGSFGMTNLPEGLTVEYLPGLVRLTMASFCPADTTGDGAVNVSDLLDLLAAWGPNPGHPADINGDGAVNVTDLLALLAAWGPCP